MKVYDTKEAEMILEPSFKFAGNPNIIVAVKAFGLKATVQVSSELIKSKSIFKLKWLMQVVYLFERVLVCWYVAGWDLFTRFQVVDCNRFLIASIWR